MKKVLILSLGWLVLCGCETTGDPHQGGIFWSEAKAQQRLNQKKEELRDVQSDTARRRARSSDDNE